MRLRRSFSDWAHTVLYQVEIAEFAAKWQGSSENKKGEEFFKNWFIPINMLKLYILMTFHIR